MKFGLVKVGHGRGMRVRGRGASLKPLFNIGKIGILSPVGTNKECVAHMYQQLTTWVRRCIIFGAI